MALTKINSDLNIIQGLDRRPNANEGLSYEQMQAKFDEAGNTLKTYINDTLTTEADTTFATKEEVQGITLGEIPDDSLTNAKLAPDIKIGSLASLETTDKSSVVNAINELDLSIKQSLAVGTYTGDGTVDREINIGFEANRVLLVEDSPSFYYLFDAFKPTGGSEHTDASGDEHRGMSVVKTNAPNGFYVTSYANNNGVLYHYVAF